MSVLIKDMEKPKSCYAVIDGEFEYCPFVNTDDDCILLLKKGSCEGTWADLYSKCPLIETPDSCEDAVSRQAVSSWLKQYGQDVLHGKYKFSLMYIWKNLMDLPSAQPEIIRCKDCKHSEHWYRDKRRCFLWAEDGVDVFDDGFCNYAERREE